MKHLLLAGLALFWASPGEAQVPLTLDTSFRSTFALYPVLYDVLPLADGSVVASGIFPLPANGFGPYGLLKFLPNGIRDESWALEGGPNAAIHPHGTYFYLSGQAYPKRYFQSTGDFDYSFTVGSTNYPYPGLGIGDGGDIYVQTDGKVLFTGDLPLAQQYGINAPGYYSLLRVNADATLDSTFEFRQTDGVIWSLEPTTQGRFLVSGVYNTYEGLPAGRILRIWPDGSLDTTFHTNIVKGNASSFFEQANGRIIAGGHFVVANEPDTLHLIRLMPNGTLDPTFNNHTDYKLLPYLPFGDFGFGVYAILPLDDGTMLVGGDFNYIDGQLRRGIALLDSAGILLNTALTGQGCGLTHDFNDDIDFFSGVSSIKMAPDGSIFVVGAFHGFDDGTVSDTSMNMICKLHGLSVGIHELEQPVWSVRVFPNPGTELLNIETDATGSIQVQVFDRMGRTTLAATSATGKIQMDTSGLAEGLYIVMTITNRGSRVSKWTKQ